MAFCQEKQPKKPVNYNYENLKGEIDMEEIEVFEIDDDFDPLEDTGLELDENEEYTGMDYQVPIPDADRSIVPEPVILPPAERIEKLISGLPGQKFRILTGIRVCTEPKTLEEASAELEEKYPQGTSVYTAARIIELLCDAGALDRIDPEEPAGEEDANNDFHMDADASASAMANIQPENTLPASEPQDDDRIDCISLDQVDLQYDEVEPAAPSLYVATEDGLAAIEERWNASLATKVVIDEPQYMPIWKKLLSMCAEDGGKTKNEIANEIDADPLLQEPRRWCQYFIEKLKDANAIEWKEAWVITDIGMELLQSDVFSDN